METLTAIFEKLLEMGLTALPVLAVVLAVRAAILKFRAPRKYAYALWVLAGFRLVCPVSLPSPVSLFNAPAVQAVRDTAQGAIRTFGQTVPGYTGAAEVPGPGAAAAAAGESFQTLPQPAWPSLSEVGAALWAMGLAAMLIWAAASYLRVRRSVRQAVRLEDRVYQCDGLSTPFVLGYFRPRVYVPFCLEEGELDHILLHERTHIRRGDPWWKLLGFCILAAYWWNPAAWLCYFLLCRDMEMSCDEAVLRAMGPEVKQSYSLSLVSFAAGRRFPAASPLAFGEGDAAKRVKNVLNWKRAVPAAAFLAAALCVLAVMIGGTDAPRAARGWVEPLGQVRAGGRTDMRFQYEVPKDVHSYLFYEEVYEKGVLQSREPVVCGEFGDGMDRMPRSGEGAVGGFADGADGAGWSFTRPMEGGTITTPSGLAQRPYMAFSPQYLGDSSADRRRWDLGGLDAAAVLILSDDGILHGYTGDFGAFSPERLRDNDAAAVLRVEFSRLSAEALLQAFEADGPGSGAALFGDNRLEPGGTRSVTSPNLESLNAAYRYETDDPAIQTITYYFDLYVGGELASSQASMSLGVAGKPCKTDVELTASMDLAAGAMVWSLRDGGGSASYTPELPAGPYAACHFTTPKETVPLNMLGRPGGAVLATANLLFENRNAAKSSYDVRVQLRMELSRQPLGVSVSREAQALYDLRTLYAGDAPAVGKILEALGVGELGAYSMELFTSERPYTLQVNFRDMPRDIDPTGPSIDGAMTRNAALLLALVGNLEQVNWSYPLQEDGQETLITVYNPLDNTACPPGWTVKECGQSAGGVEALLAYYDPEKTDSPPSAAEWCLAERKTARSWALSTLLGDAYWQYSYSGGDLPELKVEFYDAPADAADLNGRMERAAMLILALDGETETVMWRWPGGDAAIAPGSDSYKDLPKPDWTLTGRRDTEARSFTAADADAALQALGGAFAGASIRDCGKSPEALQPLLDWLLGA